MLSSINSSPEPKYSPPISNFEELGFIRFSLNLSGIPVFEKI